MRVRMLLRTAAAGQGGGAGTILRENTNILRAMGLTCGGIRRRVVHRPRPRKPTCATCTPSIISTGFGEGTSAGRLAARGN